MAVSPFYVLSHRSEMRQSIRNEETLHCTVYSQQGHTAGKRAADEPGTLYLSDTLPSLHCLSPPLPSALLRSPTLSSSGYLWHLSWSQHSRGCHQIVSFLFLHVVWSWPKTADLPPYMLVRYLITHFSSNQNRVFVPRGTCFWFPFFLFFLFRCTFSCLPYYEFCSFRYTAVLFPIYSVPLFICPAEPSQYSLTSPLFLLVSSIQTDLQYAWVTSIKSLIRDDFCHFANGLGRIYLFGNCELASRVQSGSAQNVTSNILNSCIFVPRSAKNPIE